MECTDTSLDRDQGRWRLAAPARLFARDRRGAITLTFALLLLPLLAAIGLAIDFGNVMTMRTKAQMAADAAALQAVGTARELISAGGRTEPEILLAVLKAKQRGANLFEAHAQQLGLKDYTADVVVTRTGVNLSAVVNFSLNSPNVISKVVGYTSFKAAGGANAAASLPKFSDVYLALDISQSMGIAATQAGMNTLYNATGDLKKGTSVIKNQPIKCVFGCHMIEYGPAPYSSYMYTETLAQVAKRIGVDLRIDVVRAAAKNMVAKAKAEAGGQKIYRLAFYTMGVTANKTEALLTELSALTDDYTALDTSVNAIDLKAPLPYPNSGLAESYTSENVETFATKVTTAGDGSTQAAAKKYAFIITDGLRNVRPVGSATCYSGAGRCVSTISARSSNGLTAGCEALKAKNVTVAVLYTTYMPVRPYDTTRDDFYQLEVVNNIQDMTTLSADLKKCASPGWFYEASEADAIKAAMSKMFEQTTTLPTLVN